MTIVMIPESRLLEAHIATNVLQALQLKYVTYLAHMKHKAYIIAPVIL